MVSNPSPNLSAEQVLYQLSLEYEERGDSRKACDILLREGFENLSTLNLNRVAKLSRDLGDTETEIRAKSVILESYDGLCTLLQSLLKYGKVSLAEKVYTKIVQRYPDYTEPLIQKIQILLYKGERHSASEIIRNIFSDDRYAELRGRAIMISHYSESIGIEEQASFKAKMSGALSLGTHRRRSRHGTLEVGFVSGDLHRHSVTLFLKKLFKHYDRKKMRITCFSLDPYTDEVSEEIRSLVNRWIAIDSLSIEEGCEAIRACNLDVAVDLGGYTRTGKIGLFRKRIAPVQISWLGYPSSTGIANMDYRISCRSSETQQSISNTSERILYIDPVMHCFEPAFHSNIVSARNSERFVFASCNNIFKLSDETARMWGEVLRVCSNAVMRIKSRGLSDSLVCASVKRRLVDYGARCEQIELVPLLPNGEEQYAFYNDVDLMLDSFLYSGTATTCEALWMGVPCVTRTGERHCSNVSASFLRTLKMERLIATSHKQYVQLACSQYNRGQVSLRGRAKIRSAMEQSALMNGVSFANKFQEVISFAVYGQEKHPQIEAW